MKVDATQAVTSLTRRAENYFVSCLAELIGLEKDLEVLKINLGMREDFNLIDAFGILDTQCKS